VIRSADAVATAKRDLREGEILGRGGIPGRRPSHAAADSLRLGALPLGLASRLKLARPLGQGDPVLWSDVAWEAGGDAVRLRREMEEDFGHSARQVA